jgi:hypothetical protein
MEWSKTNAKAGLGVLNCLTDSSAFVRNYVVSQACYAESVDAHRHLIQQGSPAVHGGRESRKLRGANNTQHPGQLPVFL